MSARVVGMYRKVARSHVWLALLIAAAISCRLMYSHRPPVLASPRVAAANHRHQAAHGTRSPSRWFIPTIGGEGASLIAADARLQACYEQRDRLLLQTTSSTKAMRIHDFETRMTQLRECLELSHMDIFWAMWLTPVATWGDRQHLFMDSLFVHHPNACLIILSIDNTGEGDASAALMSPKQLGYCVVVVKLDCTGLHRSKWWANDANKLWLREMTQAHCSKKRPLRADAAADEIALGTGYPYLASHLSDYLRFYLLFRFGGTYVDTDTIFLQGIPWATRDFYGLDFSPTSVDWFVNETAHHYAAPGVVRARASDHVMRYALDTTFDLKHYDPSCFNCVGPRALNLALKYSEPDIAPTYFPPHYLYPLPYNRAYLLFQADRPIASLYLQHVQRYAYALHLFGHASKDETTGKNSAAEMLIKGQRLGHAVTDASASTGTLEGDAGIKATGRSYDIVAPRVMIVRGNSSRLAGPHAAFARGPISAAGAAGAGNRGGFSVKVHARFGSISAAAGSDDTQAPTSNLAQVDGVSTLKDVNLFLSNCVYQVPPINANDTVEITLTLQRPCPGKFAARHRQLCTKSWSRTVDVFVFHRLVTVITHTHGRVANVLELHDSVQKWFPGTAVIASEDTGAALPTEESHIFASGSATLRWLRQPHDCGLSYARNTMMLLAPTPFVQLLDDDFTLDEQSHLDVLLERLLTNDDVAIAGPIIPADIAKGWHFQGLIKASNGALELARGNHGYVNGCDRVDYVPNVFLARKSMLLAVDGGWDPQLKLGEHEEFFWRLSKTGFGVLSCRFVGVTHNQFQWWSAPRTQPYVKNRQRVYDYYGIALKKHNLSRLVSGGYVVYPRPT